MITYTELMSELAHCCGTEFYHRFGLRKNVICTDGAKLLADLAGAYWLLNAISSYQTKELDKKCDGTQFWSLKSNGKGGSILTCRRDRGTPVLVRQEFESQSIKFTEGEMDEEVSLWVEGSYEQQVILLPSEH